MVDVRDPLELFSESDVANLLAKELRQNLRRYRQNPHPRGILLAGQPGAGKTGLSDLMISLLDGNAVFINADEYRRYHPNYRALYQKYGVVAVEKTAAFSATVTEKLIAEMSDRHINLIIEGTGRTVEVPRATARLLASKGYDVELAVLAVRPETSLTSTLLRFYQMNEGGTIPRATAVGAHDAVVRVLPENLDVLCEEPSISRLTIWDRELRCLFDSVEDRREPSAVLVRFWNRPWTEEELRAAERNITLLRQQETASQLGQGDAIDELEHRIRLVQSENYRCEAFDPEMTF